MKQLTTFILLVVKWANEVTFDFYQQNSESPTFQPTIQPTCQVSPIQGWTLLPSLFATSSIIPTDITFKVVDKDEQLVANLVAHKMII